MCVCARVQRAQMLLMMHCLRGCVGAQHQLSWWPSAGRQRTLSCEDVRVHATPGLAWEAECACRNPQQGAPGTLLLLLLLPCSHQRPAYLHARTPSSTPRALPRKL